MEVAISLVNVATVGHVLKKIYPKNYWVFGPSFRIYKIYPGETPNGWKLPYPL
jgi:hypothetical protein